MDTLSNEIRLVRDKHDEELYPLDRESRALKRWFGSMPKSIKLPQNVVDEITRTIEFLDQRIERLTDKKRKEMSKFYRDNNMVAGSLEELGKLRGGVFEEREPSLTIDALRSASCPEIKESAYYCENCGLWLIGPPQEGSSSFEKDNLFAPDDCEFCDICGSEVGHLKFEVVRHLRMTPSP